MCLTLSLLKSSASTSTNTTTRKLKLHIEEGNIDFFVNFASASEGQFLIFSFFLFFFGEISYLLRSLNKGQQTLPATVFADGYKRLTQINRQTHTDTDRQTDRHTHSLVLPL